MKRENGWDAGRWDKYGVNVLGMDIDLVVDDNVEKMKREKKCVGSLGRLK